MSAQPPRSTFSATLRRPARAGDGEAWCFVVLPREMSDTLPRRGRCTVAGSLNGQPFQATLEPDGQLSHWLPLSETFCVSAEAQAGDTVVLEIAPVTTEPEPQVPADLQQALHAAPAALSVWQATTTLARLDWIHWIESAKQARTRSKRIDDACAMLASGKKRVCCFDPSGFYSKALRAPDAAD